MEANYCYGNSICRITWKPYLEGGIRYRYAGENEKLITSQNGGVLSFDTNMVTNLSSNQPYRIRLKSFFPRVNSYTSGTPVCGYRDVNHFASGAGSNDGVDNRLDGFFVWGPIYGWRFADYYTEIKNCANFTNSGDLANTKLKGYTAIEINCHGKSGGAGFTNPARSTNPVWFKWLRGLSFPSNNYYVSVGFDKLEFEPTTPLPPQCKFDAFEDDQIIYTETRDVCPEARIVPCQLEPKNQGYSIVVNKPKNHVVVVTSFTYTVTNGAVTKTPLPKNKLNVYEVVRIPNVDYFDYVLKGQMISSCPDRVPEYKVECLDNESCPPGTCAVDCHGHTCCYDKNGYVVKQIN